MFDVAHLSGWDMIVQKPALEDVRATISGHTAAVTIQHREMDRFSLRMWRGNRITDQKSDLSTAANSILALADELAVRAEELENRFNLVVEFAALFVRGCVMNELADNCQYAAHIGRQLVGPAIYMYCYLL